MLQKERLRQRQLSPCAQWQVPRSRSLTASMACLHFAKAAWLLASDVRTVLHTHIHMLRGAPREMHGGCHARRSKSNVTLNLCLAGI